MYLEILLNKILIKLDFMEIAKEDFIRFCKEYIEINNEIHIEKKK
jgi:hypothetical protein